MLRLWFWFHKIRNFFSNQELEPSSGRHRETRTTRWKVKNLNSSLFFINIGTRPLFLKWKYHRHTIGVDFHYAVIKLQQAQNRHIHKKEDAVQLLWDWRQKKPRILRGDQTHELGLHIFWQQVTLPASFFCHSSALVQWLSGGMYAQGPSGCLTWDLSWTRSIPCAPFAQTAASHCLDYSTALPVPSFKLILIK